MQQQEFEQQNQPNLIQRLRMAIPFAIQIVEVISKASRQDSLALQIEDALVKDFERLNIPVQSIQLFKDQLAKARQRADHGHREDIYLMGGILIYSSILFAVLISLGVPDFSTRFAWIVFAISFPCTIGFSLVHFLKEKNAISSYGWIHSSLAFIAEIGVIATTAGLFFHIWNIVGWIFLFWVFVIFLGYQRYRWSLYYKPFLRLFEAILKKLSDTPPRPV